MPLASHVIRLHAHPAIHVGPHARRALLLSPLALALALGACDAGQRARDASAPSSQRTTEVSVRVELAAGGEPSVSVLAFRAEATGVGAADVLGIVDPLVALAPEGRCELRDVAGAARALRARGGSVELEEMGPVFVLSPMGTILRTAPRVYPQVAGVVGGVIGEAGPVASASPPETLTLILPGAEGELPHAMPVVPPTWPRLLGGDGAPLPPAGRRLEADGDLTFTLAGPDRAFVEVRPFGSPLALACPAGAGGRVTVPREMIDRLRSASGRVPFSVEAVWREGRVVMAGGHATRVSIEARSSATVELAP